jgi:arginyl-tRNA synthetase
VIKELIKNELSRYLKHRYQAELTVEFVIERDPQFGDLATNVAFSLSKLLKRPPKEVASQMASDLGQLEILEKVEVGGAGFLNIYLKKESLCEELSEILARGDRYGSSSIGGGERVLVEFVSANPTGPLLVVNARAAAIGDSLVRILKFAGYDARAEYYVNDAGHQVDLLAESVICRSRELRGEPTEFPDGGYHGEYVKDLAREIPEEKTSADFVKEYALKRIIEGQKGILEAFRVRFDHWVRESEVRPRLLKKVEVDLREKGAVYESEGALWLSSSEFGDEKDRVLIKRDGEPTYLLPDLAYHTDKFSRGYNRLLNIWGPDHHGYISRLLAGVQALGYTPGRLQILIAQQVNLKRGGQRVMMSKREGEFTTMEDLLQEVGVDAARFFFLLRKNSSHLDFNIDLARKSSEDNPVYYVQYAHARICSIMRFADEQGIGMDRITDFPGNRLTQSEEFSLIKRLMIFPDVVERVCSTLDPHTIPYYLVDLATVFHNFYQKHRVVGDDADLTVARLALVEATRRVIETGLNLIGVSAPEEM